MWIATANIIIIIIIILYNDINTYNNNVNIINISSGYYIVSSRNFNWEQSHFIF